MERALAKSPGERSKGAYCAADAAFEAREMMLLLGLGGRRQPRDLVPAGWRRRRGRLLKRQVELRKGALPLLSVLNLL